MARINPRVEKTLLVAHRDSSGDLEAKESPEDADVPDEAEVEIPEDRKVESAQTVRVPMTLGQAILKEVDLLEAGHHVAILGTDSLVVILGTDNLMVILVAVNLVVILLVAVNLVVIPVVAVNLVVIPVVAIPEGRPEGRPEVILVVIPGVGTVKDDPLTREETNPRNAIVGLPG